jgi:ornithine decarboxylase
MDPRRLDDSDSERTSKAMTDRIARFLDERRPATPCLVIDLDQIEQNYSELRRLLPLARIFYAVKANPAPEAIQRLAGLGSSFDAASAPEIRLCLEQGASPERISFGNTIKKARDIAEAHKAGVRLFAFDSLEELEKIAAHAPGAQVFCRILIDCAGADWPLSRKFGCSPAMAERLMARAAELGLKAQGLSFHVGSQQTDLGQWDRAVAEVGRLFRVLAERGVALKMLNLGGGFPARYRSAAPAIEAYAAAVMEAMTRHFGNDLPEMVIEPGRSLVSRKDEAEERRWVYLDIGKFGGLAETMDEAIKYRITTSKDGGETGPVILAGPTCDSVDILYERTEYRLPLDLKSGDLVRFHSAGAYTSSYASVGFNGFAPLAMHCI